MYLEQCWIIDFYFIEGGGGKAFCVLSHAVTSGSGIRYWSRCAIANFFRTKYYL